MTSKGTITIAAPLRKALGLRPGQKMTLSLDHQRQLVVRRGISVEEFEAIRDKMAIKIPEHLKGLSGDALREAAAKAWAADND